MSQLFSTQEVAALFGVRPSRISKWKLKGIIKASGYVADRPYYTAEDIAAVATVEPRGKRRGRKIQKTETNG